MNNKIGLVTMCRKAGKLVMGMDMVKDACNTGKACAVFAATDFSPKSLKEIKFNCYKNGIKLYGLGNGRYPFWSWQKNRRYRYLRGRLRKGLRQRA